MSFIQTLKLKIKILIAKLKYKNKYSISYKGKYIVQYLLDVYINCTKEDYIEEYEKLINSILQKMEQKDFFSIIKQKIGNEVSDKKEFAAVELFAIICFTLNEKERELYLSQVNNPIVRYFIKKFYMDEKLNNEELEELRKKKENV